MLEIGINTLALTKNYTSTQKSCTGTQKKKVKAKHLNFLLQFFKLNFTYFRSKKLH
jgi:hypothetical protein